MSISTRNIFALLLCAAVAAVPVTASAQPPQNWQQRGPGPGWQGGGPHHPGWQGGGGPGWQGGGGPGWQGGHGPRYYRGDRRDDGGDAAIAAGIIGLAIGAIAAGAASQQSSGGSHERWCLQRYRSYDPGSDTYLGRDGRRHYCR